ncbi:MAG: fasciclin domain-containing protein [Prolixibacteraceae bacterium]|jgi:hypothetical protein|nr:fasciclin domain-containing protein [Prolixibacteraceae bacterium]
MNRSKENNRRTLIYLVFLILPALLFQFCSKDWENHYGIKEETVNGSMWDAIQQVPEFSLFVSYMQKYGLDSIFGSNLPMTLFIPPNETLESVADTGNFIPKLLIYHMSPSVCLIRNIKDAKKILTVSGKYALIENEGSGYRYDNIPIVNESPLYNNGKFYTISNPAIPKPNLYELTEMYSGILKNYIDSRDSVFLDLNKSKPIGFDEFGNTVYDSVIGKVNLFEQYYFPVKNEFRDQYATFILFTQAQYDQALDVMASRLGGGYSSGKDIPLHWQYGVLIPTILNKSLFDGKLEYSELLKDTLKNIAGDTVVIQHGNIDPLSRFECSNGLVYNYSDFQVPLDLYLHTVRVEGENLVDSIGVDRFAWKEGVTVSGAIVRPSKLSTQFESIVNVDLGRNYSGKYSVRFTFKDVWPTKYRLVWRANYRPSGLYAVYVNEQKIGQFDTYSLINSVVSVTGERFIPSANGFNRKDFWVENITEFGDVSIRFEYLGSGLSPGNGFNIDYVELVPVNK